MNKFRAAVIGATAAGLLGLPAAALATAPASGVRQSATDHRSSIRWMAFSHIKVARAPMTIVGQVVSSAHGERGALAGVRVWLYRKLDSGHDWVFLQRGVTSQGTLPQFRFATPSWQNATYKVVFPGSPGFARTSRNTWLEVHRAFGSHLADGAGAATFTGTVTPFYQHRSITLQRKSCLTCSYVDYKTATTGTGGTFKFYLPAAPVRRWWWRATVPGETGFIASYSATIVTQRV